METITIDKDISVFYVTARSFPDGIDDAIQRIHSLAPMIAGRRYFGISRPENGTIVYRAAVEEIYEHEGQKLNCDTLLLKHGKYIYHTVYDFMKNLPEIGKTFQHLLAQPGIDPEGYCVEIYVSDRDVQCMVRLKD